MGNVRQTSDLDAFTSQTAELLAGRRDAASARTLGRLLTALEDSPLGVGAAVLKMVARAPRAHVIALTGAPGVGKSTLTAALVGQLRGRGVSVGVLAVDPSSPRTGGALLGDRIRMSGFELDRDVFIRSMSSRGSLGGISVAAPSAVRALDAAGFDTVIVETVGVGQSEVDACAIADTSVLVSAPGMGDEVQASKAGIVEMVDVFVVNKADRPGAEVTRRHLRRAGQDRPIGPGQWRPPVVLTTASNGDGVGAVLDSLEAHRDHLISSGELERRRTLRFEREVELFALGMLRGRIQEWSEDGRLAASFDEIRDGRVDPLRVARALFDDLQASHADVTPTPT